MLKCLGAHTPPGRGVRRSCLPPPPPAHRLLTNPPVPWNPWQIFSYTVWRGQPTPGMRLLNLRHRDERSAVEHSTSAARVPPVSVVGGRTGAGGPGLTGSQRAMYGFIAVGGRYALARLARASAGRRWADAGAGRHGAAAARGLRVAENVLQAAGLANFVLFLAGGRHRCDGGGALLRRVGGLASARTRWHSAPPQPPRPPPPKPTPHTTPHASNLLERVIGAGLVPADVAAPRALSFDYLNRQIVWHELSELMLFVLPLIDPGRARRAVRALLPRAGALAGGGAGGGAAGPGSSSSSTSHLGPCGICGAPSPAVPYTALPCGHPHCYWCLAQATAADPRFECGCGKRVAAMIRAARAVGLADGGCPAGGPGGGR